VSEFITTAPREHQDTAGKIRTYTGKYVDPFNMAAEDIDIRDIAHHLSLINRYTGATPLAYSVAQHSVAVSRHFIDPELRLAGLLHDAGEYVLNDIASPVKRHPAMAAYVEALDRLDALVFRVFGLNLNLMKTVKPFDDMEFTYEVATFWGTIDLKRRIRPLPAQAAEQLFLSEFKAIMQSRVALQDTGT
jgi:hypothetical protein